MGLKIEQVQSKQELHRFVPPSRTSARQKTTEENGKTVSDKRDISRRDNFPPGRVHHHHRLPIFVDRQKLVSMTMRRHSLG